MSTVTLSNEFARSFDAKEWAQAFVEHVQQNPAIATDEGTMLGWFANAIMRGYDEAKYDEEKRQVENGRIQFEASIPGGATAIAIDGGKDEGGRLKLDVSGDYLLPLVALTSLRGRVLHVTIVPQPPPAAKPKPDDDGQTKLFPAQGEDRQSITDQAAAATERGFVDPEVPAPGATAPTDMPGVGDAPLPDHVHKFNVEGVCEECGEPKWTEEEEQAPTIVQPPTEVDEAHSTGPGNTQRRAGVGSARAHRVRRNVLRKGSRRRKAVGR